MDYVLIYEASKNSFLTLPTFILFAVATLFCIYMVKNWNSNGISGRIGMCIVAVLLFVFIISVSFNYMSTESIYTQYVNGKYHIVEGLIENYELGTDERGGYCDAFTVDNLTFFIPSSMGGYSLRQKDGGVLKNGQKCIIYYVSHKEMNVIMKLYLSSD